MHLEHRNYWAADHLIINKPTEPKHNIVTFLPHFQLGSNGMFGKFCNFSLKIEIQFHALDAAVLVAELADAG